MGFDEYQRLAMRTARSEHPAPYDLANFGLGAMGESGEIGEMVKKHVFHGHEMDPEALSKEIGDELWYLAVMAKRFDLSLQDIAEQNIAKLRERYPDGFTEQASQERIEYVQETKAGTQ